MVVAAALVLRALRLSMQNWETQAIGEVLLATAEQGRHGCDEEALILHKLAEIEPFFNARVGTPD